MKLETIAAPMVNLALTEDLGSGDVTAAALVSESAKGRAQILAKSEGVVAGLDVARMAFYQLDSTVIFRTRAKDGSRVVPGDVVCVVEGVARAILSAERVALNFLQRLSGIATHTARFVAAVEGTGVQIRDTRKTTPVLRMLEKYAVMTGGGANHRFGLFDMALLKENHLRAAPSISAAVRRIRQLSPGVAVEVEARTAGEAMEAKEAGVEWILLDNMTPEEVRQTCVELAIEPPRTDLKDARAAKLPEPAVEASGGITLDNARAFAETGVHALAIGAITHSAPAMDFSLLIDSMSDHA